MPNLIRDTAIAVALLLGTAACATPAQTGSSVSATMNVTGETVSNVVFENGGRLARSGENEWTEYSSGNGQPVGRFLETKHGDWTVYLDEVDSNKRLQIDLYKGTLSYEYGEGTRNFLYNLTSATSDVPPPLSKYVSDGVNGSNLVQATFKGDEARFEQSTDKVWLEYDRDGKAIYTFAETGRDEWSVYLLDEGRGIAIQLDVHREMILLGESGGEMEDKWPMTDAMRLRDSLDG